MADNRFRSQDELIREELRRNGGNISKAARVLGVDFYMASARYGEQVLPPLPKAGPEPEDIRVLGRPGFQQHVIAVKPVGGTWPEKYTEVLKSAREKFDNGTHEMFQTTEKNGWVVQYLIPRRRSIRRRPFFRNLGI